MDEARNGETRAKRRGRGRRSRLERAQVLSEYRASGLTQEKYAAQAGLKVGTLRAWIYKKRPRGRGDRGHFAPVRIVGGARPLKSGGVVTMRWPQGIEVEIAVALDGPGVGRLVRALLAPCLR
jgi:hypothetical protein